MSRSLTRRTVLQGTTAVAGLAATAGFAGSDRAQTIVRNARIFTADVRRPWAQAIALSGGRIIAVGSNATIDGYRAPATHVIDAGGRLVIPGIIDSHTHIAQGSLLLTTVDVTTAKDVAGVQALIGAFALRHPGTGWLRGFGWEYDQFKPGGLPTKEQLDAVVSDRPAMLNSYDFHNVWVNSRALAAAGITRTTPDPESGGRKIGEIVRDPRTGEATGVLKEGAVALMARVVPKPTLAEGIAQTTRGMAYLNSFGITASQTGSGDLDELAVYAAMHERGLQTVRVRMSYAGIGTRHEMTAAELRDFATARSVPGRDWLRGGTVKFFADGVIETKTAHMLRPYTGHCCVVGPVKYSEAELRHHFAELDRLGYQIMTHAIGDGAVRMTLDAYEATARANGPRDRRFRIEHIETCSAADIPRFARLGTIASMQPLHCCPDGSGTGQWERNLGEPRLPTSFAWHEINAAGGTLVFGSDWPVVTPDPYLGMQNAVLRENLAGSPHGGYYPENRVSIERAVLSYTRDAAHAAFFDDVTGTLAPGKAADLVVLSQDLFAIPANDIHATRAQHTVVGGKLLPTA